jgi:hypothetical protein
MYVGAVHRCIVRSGEHICRCNFTGSRKQLEKFGWSIVPCLDTCRNTIFVYISLLHTNLRNGDMRREAAGNTQFINTQLAWNIYEVNIASQKQSNNKSKFATVKIATIPPLMRHSGFYHPLVSQLLMNIRIQIA